MLAPVIVSALHLLLLLLLAPFLAGLSDQMRARLAGRPGAPLLQPFRDLMRLWRKQVVMDEAASPLAAFLPAVICTLTLVAAFFGPGFASGGVGAGGHDVMLVIGLLAAARLMRLPACLENGGDRDLLQIVRFFRNFPLAETALFTIAFGFALSTGSGNLAAISSSGLERPGMPPMLFALPAFLILAASQLDLKPFGEPSRPGTGNMIEDNFSGRALALVRYSAMLHQLLLMSLFFLLFLPAGMMVEGQDGIGEAMLAVILFFLKLSAAALLVPLLESCCGFARPCSQPLLLGGATILALLALILS